MLRERFSGIRKPLLFCNSVLWFCFEKFAKSRYVKKAKNKINRQGLPKRDKKPVYGLYVCSSCIATNATRRVKHDR